MKQKAWAPEQAPSQKGKIAVVTGTGGLGYETALVLAQKGAEVILAGRNPDKGNESVSKIKALHPGALIRFEALDLASLKSVADFSVRLSGQTSRLDLLVNNAGVMTPPKRKTTTDGFELQFGTNYLGHFSLTAHLLPLLKAAQGARVVNVCSLAHRGGKIRFNDLQWEQGYRPFAAYGQSKLANLMFSLELQRRSDANNWKITSVGSHPGFALTELIPNGPGAKGLSSLFVRYLMQWWASQSPADGALPSLFAAMAVDAQPGGYYGPDTWLYELKGPVGPAKIMPQALDQGVAKKLWEVSEKLTNTHWPKN